MKVCYEQAENGLNERLDVNWKMEEIDRAHLKQSASLDYFSSFPGGHKFN